MREHTPELKDIAFDQLSTRQQMHFARETVATAMIAMRSDDKPGTFTQRNGSEEYRRIKQAVEEFKTYRAREYAAFQDGNAAAEAYLAGNNQAMAELRHTLHGMNERFSALQAQRLHRANAAMRSTIAAAEHEQQEAWNKQSAGLPTDLSIASAKALMQHTRGEAGNMEKARKQFEALQKNPDASPRRKEALERAEMEYLRAKAVYLQKSGECLAKEPLRISQEIMATAEENRKLAHDPDFLAMRKNLKSPLDDPALKEKQREYRQAVLEFRKEEQAGGNGLLPKYIAAVRAEREAIVHEREAVKKASWKDYARSRVEQAFHDGKMEPRLVPVSEALPVGRKPAFIIHGAPEDMRTLSKALNEAGISHQLQGALFPTGMVVDAGQMKNLNPEGISFDAITARPTAREMQREYERQANQFEKESGRKLKRPEREGFEKALLKQLDKDRNGHITLGDFDVNRDGRLSKGEAGLLKNAYLALKDSLSPEAQKAVKEIRAIAIDNGIFLPARTLVLTIPKAVPDNRNAGIEPSGRVGK